MPPKMPKGIKGNMMPQKAKKGTFFRLIKLLFAHNKKLLFVILATMTVTAVTSVASSIFITKLLTQLQTGLNLIKEGASNESAFNEIWPSLVVIFSLFFSSPINNPF